MPREYGYSFNIKEDSTTKDLISKAFNDEHIIKWAYILHDQELVNTNDIEVLKYGMHKTWSEGFDGQDKYSSVDDYINEKLQQYPKIGDKKESYWSVVIITDQYFDNLRIANLFLAEQHSIRYLRYRFEISNSLLTLVGENDLLEICQRHHYSDDEVKSNFDFRAYIEEAKKGEKLELFKSNFDPAMLFSLALFAFFLVVAVKLGTTNFGVNAWLIPSIIGGIGILYLFLNIMARIASKRQNRYISGIPFISGIHLLLAGLASPVKWLALLCLLDFTIWMFISTIIGEKKKR